MREDPQLGRMLVVPVGQLAHQCGHLVAHPHSGIKIGPRADHWLVAGHIHHVVGIGRGAGMVSVLV